MTPTRLTPLDASFLPLWPQHLAVGAIELAPTDEPLTVEALRRLVGPRLPWAPRARQRIRWVPGNFALPVWEDDQGFALERHVREVEAEQPLDRAGFSEVVARLSNEPFDLAHAPWSIDLVPGLEGGGSGVVLRAHHSLADGEAMLAFFGSLLLDLPPGTPEPEEEPWTPEPPRSDTGLVLDALRELLRRPSWAHLPRRSKQRGGQAQGEPSMRAVMGLVRRGRAQRVDPAPFNIPARREVGVHIAFWDAPLEQLRAAEHRIGGGATINDVVLGAVAGGLRGWQQQAGRTPDPMRVLLPVDLDHEGATPSAGRTNRASRIFVTLPLDEPDPAERVRKVSAQTTAAKHSDDAAVEARLQDVVFSLPGPLMKRTSAWLARTAWSFNLVVSDVTGPPAELTMLGHPVVELFPLSSLSGTDGLVLTLMSSDDRIGFTMVCHAGAVADPETIASGVRADFGALGTA